MQEFGLIADIGGTNARFALAPIHRLAAGQELVINEAELIAPTALNGAEYATIAEAIEAYLSGPAKAYARPSHAVMAIACPTDQDQINMTNHTWAFKVSELKAATGLISLKFINDYNALANAIPHLAEADLIKVGPGQPVKGKPIAVTGPGTGLGLAALAFSAVGPVTLETEGGHAHYAPTTEAEIEILRFLLKKHARVSNERLISGMGLENIYSALTHLQGAEKFLSAPEISAAGVAQSDPVCAQALAHFCAIVGSYAGDVALTIGAKGGLYIAGGIIPRFIDYFQQSEFRARFEAKARLSGFVVTIPTYVVVAKQPGLLGSAAVLNQRVNFNLWD